ncbi:MAG: Omp28 family outer membrane lipoprotein [Bacteroidales bacterium]|nr:Omp28 family outer membrane lipoprotein [Bacteroidales bacterium]
MKVRIVVLAFGIAGMLFTSCDKLEAPYATAKEITVDSTKRTVLLEDYTGMKCVNCPAATARAEALAELYKGQVILIAVHAGYFSVPDASGHYTTDYRTAEGVAWFNDFQLISNPMGMVNRKPFNGKLPIGAGSWADAVSLAVKDNKVASLSIHTDYTQGTRNHLSTTIDTKFLEPLTGTYNLTVCILEDSIIGWQKNNDTAVGPIPDIENYVFNNMLRAVLNGTYGEQLTTSVDTTQTYSKTYVFTLSDSWDPTHLSLVAFVSNADTKEVIQSAKEEVIE